jgi:deoxyribonuclease V
MLMLKGPQGWLPAAGAVHYNLDMRVVTRHGWEVSTTRARELQEGLAGEVVRTGAVPLPRRVAGIDVSVNRWTKTGRAAVVVLEYPAMTVAEVSAVSGDITFPYVPGLLTFREAPLVLAAWEKLQKVPDAVLVDGQGIAHPRRIGLAAHLGLCLGVPTVGCAKSRLIGEHEEPGMEAGSTADLRDGDEVIGQVVRTRDGVKPVYVSIGHLIDLPSAVQLVLACCRGYRLPEPTRLAHQAAGGHLQDAPAAPG